MAKSAAVTGICLHQLIAREEAVIKRVIAFSGSQGRNYQLADLHSAQIVVVSDDTPVDFAALNPEGCMIVRIAAADSEQPYDVLMTRPLLVTRVMRTLDDAGALLQSDAESDEADESPVDSSDMATDKSVVSGVTATSAPDTSVTPVTVETSAQDSEEAAAIEEPAAQEGGASKVSVTDDSGEEPEVTANTEQEEPESSQLESDSAEIVDDTATEDTAAAAEGHEPGESEGAASAVAIDDADSNAHHKALVVDDSAAIRKQLELELRAAGISADFAEDGEQALEKVAANHYDLIFLDIIMPGIDGYEACRQMRLRAELKKTPIIMLSAKTSPLDEVQGVIAGASTYLTKPVKSEQLQNTLKRVAMWIDNFQVAT